MTHEQLLLGNWCNRNISWCVCVYSQCNSFTSGLAYPNYLWWDMCAYTLCNLNLCNLKINLSNLIGKLIGRIEHFFHIFFPKTKPLNIKIIGIQLGGQMHADWPIVCAVVEADRGRQSRVRVCVSCPLAVGMLPHAEAITQINARETPHSSVSGKYRNKTYKYKINRYITNSKILHFKLINTSFYSGRMH